MESGATIQLCNMHNKQFWLNSLTNEVKTIFAPIPYSLETETNIDGHFKCSITNTINLRTTEIRLACRDDVLLYGKTTVLPGVVLDELCIEKNVAEQLGIELPEWLQFEELLLLQINDGGELQGSTIEVVHFDESDQEQTTMLNWHLL